MIIRPERQADFAKIHRLVEAAFGGAAEADLVDGLRADGDVLASLVAELDGEVVGHLLFSSLPIAHEDGTIRGAALAPLCAAPARQGQGVGSALVRAGIEACIGLGLEAIVVLGQPGYYARFGFSAEAAREIRSPYSGGPAFMALSLKPGPGLRGEARYAPAFARMS